MNPFIHQMLSLQTCHQKNSKNTSLILVACFDPIILHSLGPVEPDTVEKVEVKITDEEKARLERFSNRPPLDEILNLHDFEVGRLSNIQYLYSLLILEGYCQTSDARKSMGLLFFRSGR